MDTVAEQGCGEPDGRTGSRSVYGAEIVVMRRREPASPPSSLALFDGRSRSVRCSPLPLVPTPFIDESFGSWLQRCTVAHRQASIHDFVASLLLMEGMGPPAPNCDWDCDPPQFLLKVLADRTGTPLSALRELVVQARSGILRPAERDAYCPLCFAEDIKRRAVYRRRAWLDSWTLTCATHGCLLGSYEEVAHAKSGRAASRELTPSDQVRLGTTTLGYVTGFSPPSVWWTQLHHLPRGARTADVAQGRWLDPEMCRGELGRDLVLLAGSHLAEDLYYLLFADVRRDSMCWRDERGKFVNWPNLRFPLARTRARLMAAYIAAAAWRHMDKAQPPPKVSRRAWLIKVSELCKARQGRDEWPITEVLDLARPPTEADR